MPIIRIDFDNNKVSESEIQVLSQAAQQIVIKQTGIQDVFVYANSAQIKINIAPIEIFIEMSASKIPYKEELIKAIKSSLSDWKKENNFQQPINLTLIPMDWNIEIGI